jgi:predicted Zn-dependent protease
MKTLLCSLACVLLVHCAQPQSSTPASTPEAVSHADVSGADAILLPLSPFPLSQAQALAARLSSDMNVRVKVGSSLPVSMDLFDPNTSQLHASKVQAAGAARRAELKAGNTPTVVLALQDMNFPGSGWRFCFSQHDKAQRVSAVSSARTLGSANMESTDRERDATRLFKLVKKALGIHVKGLEVSKDKTSVMYQPLGVADLDAMGTAF